MPTEPVRVFCVHSKSRPVQAKFYDALLDSLQGLDVTLSHYNEWSWKTPEGRSDEAIRREQGRKADLHRQGYSNIEGFGWLQDAPLELQLVASNRDYPGRAAVNKSDLRRLLLGAHFVIMLEDEQQEQLSAGVQTELALLAGQDKRVLNVRLSTQGEDADSRSIYPFSEDLVLNGVVGIGVDAEGEIRREDIELVTFIVALWCVDEQGARYAPRYPGQPAVDPGFGRCPVGTEPADLYRYKTAIRLATSDRQHIRRTALLYMASVRETSLRHSLCRFLARLFEHNGPWRKHLDDFLRFTESMPDIDWRSVMQTVTRSPRTSDVYLVSGAELISGIACMNHIFMFSRGEDKERAALGEILLDKLRILPRWAVVGFAAHTASSSWDLCSWTPMSRRQTEQLNETIALAEAAAASCGLSVTELVSRSSLEMGKKRLGALATVAASAAAYASAASSRDAAGRHRDATDLHERACSVVAKIVASSFSAAGLQRMLEQLDVVTNLARSRGWTDSTPLPAELFATEQ